MAIFINGSGRNEQSLQWTFHRCFLPSFGSFGYAVSEEKIFLNRPIRNKNYLWRPCLLMDRDKMSNLYRGPSIYVSYQVSVHMIEGFQRRILKCEKLTDETTDAKSSHCLWQGELITKRHSFQATTRKITPLISNKILLAIKCYIYTCRCLSKNLALSALIIYIYSNIFIVQNE